MKIFKKWNFLHGMKNTGRPSTGNCDIISPGQKGNSWWNLHLQVWGWNHLWIRNLIINSQSIKIFLAKAFQRVKNLISKLEVAVTLDNSTFFWSKKQKPFFSHSSLSRKYDCNNHDIEAVSELTWLLKNIVLKVLM